MLVYSVRVGFLGVLKDFDSTEKHQHTLQDLVVWGGEEGISTRSRVWKRLRVVESHWCPFCGTEVVHECHRVDGGSSLGHRVGVG